MSGKTAKAARHERLVISRLVVYFENGTESELDTTKVQVIDRDTKKPIFDYVIEEV